MAPTTAAASGDFGNNRKDDGDSPPSGDGNASFSDGSAPPEAPSTASGWLIDSFFRRHHKQPLAQPGRRKRDVDQAKIERRITQLLRRKARSELGLGGENTQSRQVKPLTPAQREAAAKQAEAARNAELAEHLSKWKGPRYLSNALPSHDLETWFFETLRKRALDADRSGEHVSPLLGIVLERLRESDPSRPPKDRAFNFRGLGTARRLRRWVSKTLRNLKGNDGRKSDHGPLDDEADADAAEERARRGGGEGPEFREFMESLCEAENDLQPSQLTLLDLVQLLLNEGGPPLTESQRTQSRRERDTLREVILLRGLVRCFAIGLVGAPRSKRALVLESLWDELAPKTAAATLHRASKAVTEWLWSVLHCCGLESLQLRATAKCKSLSGKLLEKLKPFDARELRAFLTPVRSSLCKLDEESRALVVQRWWLGWSYEDIAKRLPGGATRDVAWCKVHAAYWRFRQALPKTHKAMLPTLPRCPRGWDKPA